MYDEEDSRKRSFSEVENDTDDRKRFRNNKGKEPLLKLLVPNVIAGHIIGKGGSYIGELKSKYGGHIVLSGNKEYYPGTEERIVVLTGKVTEIIDLNYYIMDNVLNTGREPLRDGRGDKTKMVVTNPSAGLIIGKGGATVKQIQEDSGVKISIADSVGNVVQGERVLTMSGTLEQRADAARQIIEKIAEEQTNMMNTILKYAAHPVGGYERRSRADYDNDRRSRGDYNNTNTTRNDGGNLAPHNQSYADSPDSSMVGLIENVAASLDKRQILSALTGISMGGGAGAVQNTSNNQTPPRDPLKSIVDLQLEVPSHMVGHLMGKGGQNVKEMVRRSGGARFAFQDAAEKESESGSRTSSVRMLKVTGNFEQVQSAYNLVHDKVEEYKQYQQRSSIRPNQF